MKCICGYERREDYVDPEESINLDGEKFISINGSFHTTEEYGYGGEHEVRCNLYACPKCSTVQMEKGW